MSATELEIRNAVSSPLFSHSRRGEGCWRDVVWVYHSNPTSPTGVTLACGGDVSMVEPIIRELRHTSPLSPTER